MRNLAIGMNLVIVLLLLGGCGPSGPTQRDKTLVATLTAINAARDGFIEYDRTMQAAIVAGSPTADKGAEMLAKYRAAREAITSAFIAVYQMFSETSIATDDPSLAKLLDAVKALAETIDKFKREHLKPEPVKL